MSHGLDDRDRLRRSIEEFGRSNESSDIFRGSIGQRVNLGPSQSKTVIKADCRDDVARTFTVTIVSPDVPDNYVDLRLSLTIILGIGGINTQFPCDVVRGFSFTVSCSSIEVIASNNTTASTWTFGAFMTQGATSNAKKPQLTQSNAAEVILAAGGQLSLPIPLYARRWRVTQNFNFVPLNFQHLITAAPLLLGGAGRIGFFQNPDWIEIPGNVSQLLFTNNGAINALGVTVVWELDI